MSNLSDITSGRKWSYTFRSDPLDLVVCVYHLCLLPPSPLSPGKDVQ
jgi:hypothetical protein